MTQCTHQGTIWHGRRSLWHAKFHPDWYGWPAKIQICQICGFLPHVGDMMHSSRRNLKYMEELTERRLSDIQYFHTKFHLNLFKDVGTGAAGISLILAV